GQCAAAQCEEAVANLSHRGAVAADGKSGDGSGVLTQIPRRLYRREAERLKLGRLDDADQLGIGMFFLPASDAALESERIIEASLAEEGLRLLGWRDVPIDADQLGAAAKSTLPRIRQALIVPRLGGEDFEQAMYLGRKRIERGAQAAGLVQQGFYIASLSSRTLVYKGLFAAHQLPAFYPDLRDPEYESGLAVFHQRYSPNTFPTWHRAQPSLLLAPTGETN